MPVAMNGKKTDTFLGTVSLRGLTSDDAPLFWEWLNEYPHQNFEDDGPKTFAEFELELIERIRRGCFFLVALHNGEPVGVIGYQPETSRRGWMRGICFSKSVHRTGVAACALENFFRLLFAKGVVKVSAAYFHNNEQIRKFLKKRGFVHEAHLKKHALRRGVMTEMTQVALHKTNFTEIH